MVESREKPIKESRKNPGTISDAIACIIRVIILREIFLKIPLGTPNRIPENIQKKIQVELPGKILKGISG